MIRCELAIKGKAGWFTLVYTFRPPAEFIMIMIVQFGLHFIQVYFAF